MISSMKVHSKRGFGKSRDTPTESGRNLKGRGNEDGDALKVTFPPEAENVLTFPLLKTIDRDRTLPCYASILNRSVGEGVCMDDLDALQLELEAMLSAVVVRSRVLRREIKAVSTAEEKAKKKSLMNRTLQSSAKRQNLVVKPKRKLKDAKLREIGKGPVAIKFTKVKSVPVRAVSPPSICLPEFDPQTSVKEESPKSLQPRYDIPNKFWASVDAYCTDITEDDIRFLEELGKECEINGELEKIPPLGRHYSLRWAHEDLMTEQKEACTDQRDAKRETNSHECHMLLKKGEKSSEKTAIPLTQRLVSALMEDNIKVHGNDKESVVGENAVLRSNVFRNYVTGTSGAFERRIKKELDEQGVLEGNDQANESEDDEIVREIKRCQTELEALNNYNQMHLKRLINLARNQMARQELKGKLQDIDNEIIESYRNVMTAKQRKKTLTKTEQDHCWKTLKERAALIKQLDSIN